MASDVLIVDDERDIRSMIAGILSDEGFETREAWGDESALLEIDSRQPSMVLLDIWLQNSRRDGIEILKVIKEHHPLVPVIMISGHGNIETAVSAIHLGADDFIEKPFESDRLLVSIRRAMEVARLRRENEELRERAGGKVELIGESQTISHVRQSIEKVGPTGSRVLINGPAGSGKEVVARLIHQSSRRAAGPFVVLNAASMTPERVEEEMFGIEAAATGSGQRKLGTFELAHGGTLFIDEVADMPLETQGKILRVLQEQTFFRIGGTNPIRVDVRVVVATSRDLMAEIAGQRFREDLYYRLNVVPIRVPSLRDRREDIPLIANYFIKQSARANGLPERKLGEDAIAVLQTCDWPGNVRQLRNVIDWLLIMTPGDQRVPVAAEMLPPELVSGSGAPTRPDNGTEFMSLPLREAREMFERQYLQAQVTRFGSNISRTASFIGMERSALHRKLKSLGITSVEKS